MKRLKEPQTRGHITVTTITPTGERRQLTNAEVAERMAKILAMDPVDRVRMCFPRTTVQKETQQ